MRVLSLVLMAAVPGAYASCQCLGNNDAIPKSQPKFYGTAYGTSCKAWDMDYNYCSAEKQQQKPDRACWCPAKWCYVAEGCPGAKESQFSSEVVMYFSYEVCAAGGAAGLSDCWDQNNESLGEVEYPDEDDVTYATRTKRAETAKTMFLGKEEDQKWDMCSIDSCMYYGSVGNTRRRMTGKIQLYNPEMSEVENGAPAERAIDGDHQTWWSDNTCVHSGYKNPWWRADFGGKTHAITHVKIWQRRDCCVNRINNLQIKIGSEVCVARTQNGRKNENRFDCENGAATGDFIEISGENDALNFCEVEVYGNVADVDNVDAVASDGCKILGAENADGNTIYKVETEPYTVAVVHCVKKQPFKQFRWIDDGMSGRGP